MKNLLKEAINLRGSSIRNYVDPKGKKNFPCPECGEPLKYKRLSQRGTFYCQKCQPI